MKKYISIVIFTICEYARIIVYGKEFEKLIWELKKW